MRVAVIDSGVQLDHPDLAGQVAASVNLVGRDRPWVGETARHRGRRRHRGARRQPGRHRRRRTRRADARAALVRRAVGGDTSCTSLGLALALSAAIERGAQVINLSLGGPTDRLVGRLIDAALARRIAVVAAVDRAAERGGFPAGLAGVVAAIDEPAASAPAGTLVAPGRDVPTTVPPSRWATVSGASYAAAHVSGLLALVLELRGRSRGGEATTAAKELVVDADGRVDACASLARVRAACVCGCAATPRSESVARH